MNAAFRIRRPHPEPPVLLYDTPHSGRDYPAEWKTKATRAELRRGEDAYVDELLAGATAHGACVLEALYPRCYIDLNRPETDIDAELLAAPWAGPIAPTEKSARGLGLIRRYVVPGIEVNAGPLSVADVRGRIETVYGPYHVALKALVAALRAAHGTVWHVNWHSMKSVGNAMTPDGPGARRTDFVVSDRNGMSAEPAFTGCIADTLRGLGYSVSVNDPYQGGTIVQRVGVPGNGVHSVQVEINRALYLDEAAVAKTSGFAPLSANLDALTAALTREFLKR
ncbi:MAG: N-formylglutamate amidohydrolase [Gemmatimonadetes bacterium]|nr:N-formylglutamate amidohydrolase [Gemmatimonadota bacterium]